MKLDSSKSKLKVAIYNYSNRVNQTMNFQKAKESLGLIRDVCYDYSSYRYQLKQTRNFLKEYLVESSDYIAFVEQVFKVYFSSKKTGEKRAFDYLTNLKSSKFVQSTNKKFPLKPHRDINDLIPLIDHITEIFKINKYQSIKVISENFDTNYSFSTLLKYYSEFSK